MPAKKPQDPDGPSPAKARQLALEEAARLQAEAEAPMLEARSKAADKATAKAKKKGTTRAKTAQLVREAETAAKV